MPTDNAKNTHITKDGEKRGNTTREGVYMTTGKNKRIKSTD